MREIAGSLWRFISKPRGLLGPSAADREERRLLSDLRVARCSERSLGAAAAHGEQVVDELADVKARIADLAGRLPRGHTSAFCAFLVIYILSAMALVGAYGELRALILEMWGTLDNSYLLEYRYYASRLAKAGFFLRSSIWTGIGLLVPPVAMWFAQRKLERRHAHALNTVAAWLVLATTLVFAAALLRMLSRPLL
jgi:hypothetical protein